LIVTLTLTSNHYKLIETFMRQAFSEDGNYVPIPSYLSTLHIMAQRAFGKRWEWWWRWNLL